MRQDVDANTKRNAVRSGLEKWIAWEKETKELYERMYKELIEIGEVASACKIKRFLKNVDKELKKAQRYQLNKMAVDYDMVTIIGEQEKMHDDYKNKTRFVGDILCEEKGSHAGYH